MGKEMAIGEERQSSYGSVRTSGGVSRSLCHLQYRPVLIQLIRQQEKQHEIS